MIRALLFDIGNVLVTFDFSRAMKRVATQSPLDPEEIRMRMLPLMTDLERGALDGDDFVGRAIQAAQFRGRREDFVSAYTEIFDEIAPMSALVEDLAGRLPLFLLSNTSGLHLAYLRATYPVLAHFRGGAFSHTSGSMKPDEKIYRDAIAVTGADPEQVLYIDDLAANTAAGARFGLRTFTYDWRRHDDFAALLTAEGC